MGAEVDFACSCVGRAVSRDVSRRRRRAAVSLATLIIVGPRRFISGSAPDKVGCLVGRTVTQFNLPSYHMLLRDSELTGVCVPDGALLPAD